ncbi:methyltransferase domain-containing protein [Aeromicrobium terrae]|uniref:Methyltransferase domain-containing protein n=1 Tax=Aeromicrobium terrae TaxID=2498846 RepID=A0A5C8NJS4_9ACTN|nr:methyltransferase domain-containing protein [Aeromicrobium terrae]TXL62104.1 methyltransferase domain-containing protein [Aeromicrobium terrae]
MTATWDPTLYLRHEDDRSRPYFDLLARIRLEPRTIVDLGCGPGHLTAVLRDRWPDASIVGVDSSPEMIADAQARGDAEYVLADVAEWSPDGPVDLIISNALFQWVPDDLRVVSRLADHVSRGGAFAVQVPNNGDAPSHRLLHEVSSRPPYAEHTEGLHDRRGRGPHDYLELFTEKGWSVDAWETTYLHVLEGDDPVFSWISGTGARPILQALPDGLREEFVADYKAALRLAYPQRPWGTVLPFARTFAVASPVA